MGKFFDDALKIIFVVVFVTAWVALLTGCGAIPVRGEAGFAVGEAFASPVERERATLTGGPSGITEAQLAILRQRALALCPLFPAAAQVRCLVSQL